MASVEDKDSKQTTVEEPENQSNEEKETWGVREDAEHVSWEARERVSC